MNEFRIEILNEQYEEKYEKFVHSTTKSFIYHSLKYRKLLEGLFSKDESEYLIAIDADDNVIGCLPVFYRDGALGRVANSLPYYGAHGCVLSESDEVRKQLLEKYMNITNKSCVASTIVGSPIEDYDALYKEKLRPDFIDERIELMTYFRYDIDKSNAEVLMEQFHYKTRNAIRKAEKNGVRVVVDNSKDARDFLRVVHKENMIAVGGIPKSKDFFDLFPTVFEAGRDYNIYIARMEDKNIAAMLIFYFNETVEYYTPAILSEYRSYQPLSLMIFVAMQDAMNRRMEKWNWGGTGINQNSLYSFKSKWGTTESRYYYYTSIKDKKLLTIPKEVIGEIYSNYYVYPFNQVDES